MFDSDSTSIYLSDLVLGRRLELVGQIPAALMIRLQGLLEDDTSSGKIHYKISLQREPDSFVRINGEVTAELDLVCQRCLGHMVEAVSAQVAVGAVVGEALFDRVPDELEPMLIEGDEISLIEIIEDELILAVPVAPMHDFDDEACVAHSSEQAANNEFDSKISGGSEAVNAAPNPFLVLEQLKKS